MRQPFFYPKVIDGPDAFCPEGSPGDLCFESAGHETHDGIEFNAQGKAANWIQLSASANSDASDLNGYGHTGIRQQASDQRSAPAIRRSSPMFCVPHARGLHLMPGWSYTGRKEATRDDTVSVPGYNLFNLGARYSPGGEQGHLTCASMPITSSTSAIGKTRARATETHSFTRARRQRSGFQRTTLSNWYRDK